LKLAIAGISLLVLSGFGLAQDRPACEFQAVPAGTQKLGRWIDRENWLDADHQPVTLAASSTFMPSRVLPPAAAPVRLPAARQALAIDKLQSEDPIDGRPRSLEFILTNRLHAEGLVVLHNGRVVAERYWQGLSPPQPRLLLQGTRPLLNLLGAIGIAQGKFAADKAISHYLPSLAQQKGLRKFSVQRLIKNEEVFEWRADELAGWREAGGWQSAVANTGMAAWLAEAERWNRALIAPENFMPASTPDQDLLALMLREGHGMALSRLFCEQLFARQRPEYPVLWLTDPQGNELADGLGLALRDFARLGQTVLEGRTNRQRSKIPNWFIESLAASSGLRNAGIKGLPKGAEARYGFVHLGNGPNKIALIGHRGTSLFIDFDQRVVVALFASYPVAESPLLLASLNQFWKALGVPPAKP
jgi:CubicO group peptidase (beta-lactamase class C family)